MLKLKHKIKAPHLFGALFFSSNKEPGFTLFELLIALGLLAVIATLTITNTSFLNRFILQTEVEKLFSHCMHQQYKALMSGSNQTITFNPTQQLYTVGNQTYKLPTTIEFAMPSGAKGPPSKPTKKNNQTDNMEKQYACLPYKRHYPIRNRLSYKQKKNTRLGY